MPSDFWFRLSTYLSLVFACVCLGYSEYDLLPEVVGFSIVVIALLVASFLLDRRFELGLGKANLVGLVIGILSALWLAINLANPRKGTPMENLEWPNNLPPLVAPLLMVLIPAKLFRPKHVGDWWAMHGVAVTGVALATAMADDALFMVFLSIYSIFAAWSLVLFFYRRMGSLIAPIPNSPKATPAQILTATFDERPPRYVLGRSVLWLLLAAAMAVPIFLVLPKSDESWTLVKRKFEVGLTNSNEVDLKNTGELRENEEVAFHLKVTDADGEPAFDLPPDTLFRARALSYYESGSRDGSQRGYLWKSNGLSSLNYQAIVEPEDDAAAKVALRTIEFTAMPKERFLPMATPVIAGPNNTFAACPPEESNWPLAIDGTPSLQVHKDGMSQYRQQYRYRADHAGPAMELRALPNRVTISSVADPYYAEFAIDLLEKLIARGDIPAAALDSQDPLNRIAPEYHETVARAFADWFALSGTFRYGTKMTWRDRTIDPIVDFLKNTKDGHCERFASALCLVLRGLGIPCQYATGYKGWEYDEEGNMVIRKRAAHAWVEVLVSRKPPEGHRFDLRTPPELRTKLWHWIALDPTGAGNVLPPQKKNWFEKGASFITSLFIGYNKEKQQKAIAEVKSFGWEFGPAVTAGVLAAFAGLWIMRLVAKANRRGTGVEKNWYGSYLRVLSDHRVELRAAETPKELAARASATLADLGHIEPSLPVFLSSKLYRSRYAGISLTEAERVQIDEALLRLKDGFPPKSRP